MICCFNFAEEVLVSNVLKGDAWFVFASRAGHTRKQEHTFPIFQAPDRKLYQVVVADTVDFVAARWECFPRGYKVVGDVDNQFIDGLAPGAEGYPLAGAK